MSVAAVNYCLPFFLFLQTESGSPQPSKDAPKPDAIVRGTITNAAGREVRIGSNPVTPDETGRFNLNLVVGEPRYFEFTPTMGQLMLFLTPGDDLEINLEGNSPLESLTLSGKGAAVNQFLLESARSEFKESAQWMQAYHQIVPQEEDKFDSALDEMWKNFRKPLDEFLAKNDQPASFKNIQEARLRYGWASARVAYPWLHRQLTGHYDEKVSAGYLDFVKSLDLNDANLISLREYREFTDSYIRYLAYQKIRADKSLRVKENARTLTQYALAKELITNPVARNRALTTILDDHLRNLGSKKLEEVMADFKKDVTDEAMVKRITAIYDADRKFWEGHVVETYKKVDGADLDVHIFQPQDKTEGEKRPAFIWFHGAGWRQGVWYWCLGLCEHFRTKGMVVIYGEYRIHDRHGSTPLDSIADVKTLVRWVRDNADRLGIDSRKIVVSGFSAGGHLAAATAALQPAASADKSDDGKGSAPGALLLVSACVDPTNDPWYREMLHHQENLQIGSPAHHIRAGLPPTLMIHGTADPTCSFEAAREFSEDMKAAGNRCDIRAFEGKGHFFLLQNPDDRNEALNAADAFLKETGIVP